MVSMELANDVVNDVALDYFVKRMATASSDRTIKIYGLGAGNGPPVLLTILTGHDGPVWEVAWAHPKFGNILASCSYDGKVILWKEVAENQWSQWQVFQEHAFSANAISWGPHEFGLSLACGSGDGTVSVLTQTADGQWETATTGKAHKFGVTSVSWAPATPGSLVGGGNAGSVKRLVSGGSDNTVKVWKYSDGVWELESVLAKHTRWVRDVGWAPGLGLSKSTIASASEDGTVIIWTQAKEGDQWEGKVLHNFETPAWRLSWSLTGNILAVSDGKNNVTLWKEGVDEQWSRVSPLGMS